MYKKHIRTIAFLTLKLIHVPIQLGISRTLSCVQNVFKCIISGDRRGRFYQPHLIIEEMESLGIQLACPELSLHRMRGLTDAMCCFSWMAECLRCPCLHDCSPGMWRYCLFRSSEVWMLRLWKAWAGHSECNSDQLYGHSLRHMQCLIDQFLVLHPNCIDSN